MKRLFAVLLPTALFVSAAVSGRAQEVIRVQFEPNAAFSGRAPINFTGVESAAAAAYAAFGSSGSNTWNYCTIQPAVATANPMCSNLVNSSGTPTGVSIQFTGNIEAANDNPVDTTGSDALENDYFLIDAGPASTTAQFKITGLPASRTVYLYLYAPNFSNNNSANPTGQPSRGYTLTFTNGTTINVSSGSNDNALATVTTDSSGTISGTWSTAGNEGDWSGLQIAIPAVTQATQVFPQMAADASGWQTDFVLMNTSAGSVNYTLKLHPDQGGTVVITGQGAVSEITGTLPAHGTAVYSTAATTDSDGWAEVDSATPLSGVAVFRETNDQTSVQLTTPSTSFTIGFDSTAVPGQTSTNYVDGIAIANADGDNQATITCQAYDVNGNAIGTELTGLTIPPLGHTEFLLQNMVPFNTLPANTRGQLVCTSTTNVGVVELRAFGVQVATFPVIQ